MKIKVDFITNSSSETFVVMGAYFELSSFTEDHMDKVRKKVNDPNITVKDIYHYIDVLLEDTYLESSRGDPTCWDNRNIMIGIHYTNMMEDETLGQFRKRVKENLKTSLGLDLEVGHIEVGWENR